ncbi:hypothetical protein MMC13_003185 [Lambiella insularis]|nr:hypothetical protein [Lambiella insularis]
MDTLIQSYGEGGDFLEFYRDPALELLEQLAESIPRHTNITELIAAFNDEATSAAIIQYFRMIVGAWMTKHADEYQGWVEHIVTYRNEQIDVHRAEIEELGIKVFFDAVFVAIGVEINILYIDRSETNGIPNTIKFEPRTADGQLVEGKRPIVRLLYSVPDGNHYDLIYKDEDLINKEENPLHKEEYIAQVSQQAFLSSSNTACQVMEHDTNLERIWANAHFEHAPCFPNFGTDPIWSFLHPLPTSGSPDIQNYQHEFADGEHPSDSSENDLWSVRPVCINPLPDSLLKVERDKPEGKQAPMAEP